MGRLSLSLKAGLIPAAALVMTGGCAPVEQGARPATAAPAAQGAADATQDAAFNAFLDEAYDAQVALSPEAMTSLGIKRDYGKLDDMTDAAADRSLALAEQQVAEMRRRFSPDTLSEQGRLSYRLFEGDLERDRRAHAFRANRFPVTNSRSPMGSIPVFLINEHEVESVADAEAYVSRLVEVERVMGEISDTVRRRAAAGVRAPSFVYAPVDRDGRRIITGAPFGEGADSPVWADFKKKVTALDAPQADKDRLLAAGRDALVGPFRRGYDRLLTTMAEVGRDAPAEAGASTLPNGRAFYAAALANATTTDLPPAEVHRIGLAEVARIQAEMEVIKQRVGFTGTLQQFFAHVTSGDQFKYPNTAEGRASYLRDATAYIDRVMSVAPDLFRTLPRAPLEVRAVEPFREATAGIAFYNRPAPDGSRPGIYYINLSDMTQVLKPQIEAISYHEGAPGHHFQIALAQEIEGLPRFRRFGGYGAYTEGWGLYAEKLAKEMGFYQDPYSDFGRLSTELWRAVRLVLDTGLHDQGWSRERAQRYFRENSLLTERDIVKEVDRYIVNPGQAASYKIGELKILELRERARTALGNRYDIRDFHDAVLGGGAVPLDVLEERVDAYIAGAR
ncbi:uncharacterized protein (DUF885 family) [Sphingomonas jejuensis]|uniref:Uncharacterized protein (DUF885 family) n=1 Tax=Sphingomonas jejuensis TaxID=904715 RepID=A0ABX0XMH0_9SPHN|nr:DUF885 domain-containing protein [Sphingomonas jejuensis]NJC34429.1 uncharacterized protein (DUF885 family) [Sphingomonas jejuensis]